MAEKQILGLGWRKGGGGWAEKENLGEGSLIFLVGWSIFYFSVIGEGGGQA